jgi:hypothetical protein
VRAGPGAQLRRRDSSSGAPCPPRAPSASPGRFGDGPGPRGSGVADELEDMITDALEQCIDGLTVNKIKVIVNE